MGLGRRQGNSAALVDAYVEAGGNFFDTADLYTGGTAETWLGEFIAERGLARQGGHRHEIHLRTREPGNPNAGGNGRKNIMRAVEGSLKRLRHRLHRSLYLHTWDRLTPPKR